MMCRLLQVSRSGFYAWLERPLSARRRRDLELTGRICAIHRRSREAYGSPSIHAELADDHGIRVSRKRVARLMRESGIRGATLRKYVVTTQSDPAAAKPIDLVERRFYAEAPDRLWVADMTYVPTWSGWLYLAMVLDVYSRKVVGWAMGTNMRTELILEALQMAITQRQPSGVIHHSDRGSQYTSYAFGRLVLRVKFRRNICYANDLSGQVGGPNFTSPDSCRSANEELLVSNVIQNFTPLRSDQQVTFDLVNGVLPVNATDVYLQVVFEGPLGSDTHALASKTVNASEPGFFTYFNMLDYIAIDGVVHTRAEVNADLALLQRVQPQSCVNYSASPPALNASCFGAQAMDFNVTFGAAQENLASSVQLPTRRFVRLSFIGEGQPLVNGNAPSVQARVNGQCSGATLALAPGIYSLEANPSTGLLTWFIGPTVRAIRDVNVTISSGCVWDGGGNGVPFSISQVNYGLMTSLTSSEKSLWPIAVSTEY